MFVEKREVERVKTSLPINWGDTKMCILSGEVTSLSVKGCFVKTEFEAFAPQLIFINYQLKNSKWILLEGEIIYHLEKIGFGVRFKDLTYEHNLILRRLVETAKQATPNLH